MTEHEKTEGIMLRNALDFIDSATEHLVGTPTERELKYVILHLYAGIELLLKVRLHREHWTLACTGKFTKLQYRQGVHNTVGSDEALTRLKDICEVDHLKGMCEGIKRIKAIRNQIEHFGTERPADALRSEVSAPLGFVLDFIAKELKPESTLETDTMKRIDTIRSRVVSGQDFVARRLRELKPQLKAENNPILECPTCSQLCWIIRENEAKCLFCGRHDDEMSSAAESYLYDPSFAAEEFPNLAQCFECDEQAVVVGARLNNERRAFCFNCRHDWGIAEFEFHWGVDNAKDGSVQ